MSSIQQPIVKTKFTERINAKKALNVLNMQKADLKQAFWGPNENFEDSKERSWSAYFGVLKKTLKQAHKNGGVIAKEYKFGKLEGGGRLYVEGGGIQTLQSDLRNYLCGEYYYDFDIVNCHPCILLHICNSFGVDAMYLKQYVHDRQNVLTSHDLTKKDILVAMNQDNNKNKRGNDFYNCFIYEMAQIKKKVAAKIEHLDIKTSNEKNPLSSLVNKYILRFEGDIIQEAVRYFGSSAEVLMFDGVMVNKAFCPEEELPGRVNGLNALFADKYGGLVQFKVKSTESAIEVGEVANAIEEYEVAKERFERDHFLTVNPYAYWKQNKQADGSYQYNQITADSFKNACEEYQVIDYNCRDQMISTSIFKKWMADSTKRKYECIDFMPFGNNDACPPHVYNTFGGFEVNKLDHEHEEVCTKNFNQLIYNLCNEDVDTADFMMKYLAHMFQQPNFRTETIIVMKGHTGTGKDTLYRTLSALMGQDYIDITESPETLFGNFNNIMESKLALFLNELTGSDGIKYEDKLKGIATNIKNRVNEKFQKPVLQNNYCRIFVSSNNDGCVNCQSDDRRMVVIKTGLKLVVGTKDEAQKKRAQAFWSKYYTDLQNPNWRKSLYDKLMAIDLSGFNARTTMPVTQEKKVMQEKNVCPVYTYLQEMIAKKQYGGFFRKEIKGQTLHLIKFAEFATGYKRWVEQTMSPDYKIKDTWIKQKLLNMGNSFTPDKKIRYDVGGAKKSGKFACFDFEKVDTFLQNFIFKHESDETEDYGEMHYIEPKKPPQTFSHLL